MKRYLFPCLVFAVILLIFAVCITYAGFSISWIIDIIRLVLIADVSFAIGLIFGRKTKQGE